MLIFVGSQCSYKIRHCFAPYEFWALVLWVAAAFDGFPHSAMRDANAGAFALIELHQTLKMRVSEVQARENHSGGSLWTKRELG